MSEKLQGVTCEASVYSSGEMDSGTESMRDTAGILAYFGMLKGKSVRVLSAEMLSMPISYFCTACASFPGAFAYYQPSRSSGNPFIPWYKIHSFIPITS